MEQACGVSDRKTEQTIFKHASILARMQHVIFPLPLGHIDPKDDVISDGYIQRVRVCRGAPALPPRIPLKQAT